MNRRTFLTHAIGVSSLAVLSGCTDETLEDAEAQPPLVEDRYDEERLDLPVRQKFRIVAEGVESAAGVTIESVEDFESFLDAHRFEVESLVEHTEEGEEILSLEYVHERIEEGVVYRLGVVAGAYATLVGAGYEGDKLEAELVAANGEPFGHYEIPTTWAREYDDGESTAREYGRLVMKNLEST